MCANYVWVGVLAAEACAVLDYAAECAVAAGLRADGGHRAC